MTFEQCMADAAQHHRVSLGNGVEPFARIAYDAELLIKRDAVAKFTASLKLPSSLVDAVVSAPMPRGYRTTSRRRVRVRTGAVELVHGDGSTADGASPLEPDLHSNIYTHLTAAIKRLTPPMRQVLNHMILRGSYEEIVLIINVTELNAGVVRSLRTMSEHLREAFPQVQHAWIYHDPKGSRYYLDLERPATGVGAKKLFGASAWKYVIGPVQYQVGVFSFSQVNLSMVENLVDVVRDHAECTTDDVLYDIYCGYGLFGAALASSVQRVVAVDGDEATVDNARYSIRRAGGTCTALTQVIRSGNDIDAIVRSLYRIARKDPAEASNVVVIDPPRSGTAERVIAEIASGLQPRRVVEVYCGPDEIYRSTREWRQAGYGVTRVTPVDLFPGTTSMEFVITYDQGAVVAAPEPRSSPRPTSRQGQQPRQGGGRWRR
jgi:tRNA/tmRNA/rRNA uracil-C5-methylase (TrmA/RlmC/RlmD family)